MLRPLLLALLLVLGSPTALTAQVAATSRDEIGQMATALNHAMDRIRELLHGLARGATDVSRCSHELTTINADLLRAATGTAEYAAALGSGANEVSADADVVAEIEQLVKLKCFFPDCVKLHVDLQTLAILLQMSETGLPLTTN